jgi:hypothetical protein
MAIQPGSFVKIDIPFASPTMSVSYQKVGGGLWHCQWFVNGELQEGDFAPEQLIEVTKYGKLPDEK